MNQYADEKKEIDRRKKETESMALRFLPHELGHFMQSYMQAATGNENAGKPGANIRTPDYTQQLHPSVQQPIGAEFERNEAIRQRVKKMDEQRGRFSAHPNWHDLDDVEFYTLLSDEVQKFLHLPIQVSPVEHIQTSKFFKSLKNYAPEKYRKAVSEFVKAVT